MNKNKIYDLLIIILLYIGFSCIPFGLIPIDAIFIVIFEIISQIIIFLLTGLVFRKSEFKINNLEQRQRNSYYFLPIFLICFSNFFCLFDPNNSVKLSFDIVLVLNILLSVCVAFNEEIIFRAILLGNLDEKRHPLIRILIASGIFAACHLTHFISSFDPSDLIVVVYSFGIGIVLGMMYLYTGSLIFTFSFHALYNIMNNNLAEKWIIYNNGFASFYAINAIVAVISIVYLSWIYYYKFRIEKTE